jgi:leucyl aminopeptidase
MNRARDRVAEIEAAIDAVVTGTGAVTAGSAARRVKFETAASAPDGGWMPFTGSLGAVAADGATLRVGLGDAPTVEDARRAATVASALLPDEPVLVETPAFVGAIIDGLSTVRSGTSFRVPEESLADAERGLLASDVARLARLLISAPANLLTPAAAAGWARRIASAAGLECSVYGPSEVVSKGFGALAAIGGGSANGPHLVQLYFPGADPGFPGADPGFPGADPGFPGADPGFPGADPGFPGADPGFPGADPGSPGDGPEIGLVGKGITFDSGGLSLKSPAAMQPMRLDVAGAATVLAVMAGLRRLGCSVPVRAVLPFAENLPGPGAARPGDIVTAWNGTEIQILDTDFEGRVVLADALALAASFGPRLLIDLATLTYQAEIALGPSIAAVFGRSSSAVSEFLSAGERAGEPLWPLPYDERYLDQVRTPSGVRNHPLHDSGRAITAALFLGEFVPREVPWVHCDMTGPAWSGDASGDNATGFAARTLLELLTTGHSVGQHL